MLHLQIITPERTVYEADVNNVTCHTVEGDITILPHHTSLLTLLSDGIIVVRKDKEEELFSCGSGFVETDGANVRMLISSAFGQHELDEKKIVDVQSAAKKMLTENKSRVDRAAAIGMLRRAEIDLKVLRRRRRAA